MIPTKSSYSSESSLLLNMGFSSDFFSSVNKAIFSLSKKPIRKINTERSVVIEDKELNQDVDSLVGSKLETSESFTYSNMSLLFYSNFIQEQMMQLNFIINGVKLQSRESRTLVKAYRSKMKRKFIKVYEKNSKNFLEKIKYKLFHKCCYPNCGRTFSSSGWLKAHFNEHLKELSKDRYNVLFDKYINNNVFLFSRINKDINLKRDK